MCPNFELEGQGRGSSFRVCHALGRLAILLHTEGFVDSQMATTVDSVPSLVSSYRPFVERLAKNNVHLSKQVPKK